LAPLPAGAWCECIVPLSRRVGWAQFTRPEERCWPVACRALLAQVHNLLRDLEVGQEGRRPRFANHLEPAEVVVSMRRGVERIRGWDPTAAERRLAGMAEKLAELVSQAEVGLVVRLPASWSMVTSGTTTCCSATDGRCSTTLRMPKRWPST
jgi:hypothetical protein